MWTPRRILLLLLGLGGFVATYFVYARILGSIDGLPDLPQAYLVPYSGQDPELFDNPVSPTLVKLERAFGPNTPEVQDQTAYNLKLEMREKGIVFACGQPQFALEPSRFVTVSPFSVAFFGKPRPAHLRLPGEEDEITTFHADRAVLEFDRDVRKLQDISSQAKMVGMELVSDPEMPSVDRRRGLIEVTSNQRSSDPWQQLVFRTTGPLYYRAYDEANPPPPDAPQVWTTAAVEVVDRRNLPRPLQTIETVRATGDELRQPGTIASILRGRTLPPPTITAEGMKIYLQPQDTKARGSNRNATGYDGVRMVELTEKVRFCQWGDGRSALGPSGATGPGTSAPPVAEPPEAAGALAGAAFDAAVLTRKLETRTLLVIETLGSFRYDFQKNVARFDAAAIANPAIDNHVVVGRLSATGKQDNLFCRQMVVEFTGSPQMPTGAASRAAAEAPAEGRRVKSLTATGPHVFVAIESEQLVAKGTELVYTVDPKTRQTVTVLRGNPVTAVREKNRLEGGTQAVPGEVVILSTDPNPAIKDDRKQTTVLVRGRGRIQMVEDDSNATTFEARWGRSLTHERVRVGSAEQDLLTFDGGGTFIDSKGDMKLSADLLKLWLASRDGAAKVGPEGERTRALPQQVVAIGKVESDSPDLVIRNSDQLTVWFRDVPPPKELEPKIELPPMGFVGPLAPTGPPPLAVKPDIKTDEPVKPKSPPVQLSARVIESWMTRYPKKPEPGPDAKAAEPTLKYELERARCEDRVVVHQDAADPGENPYGLDITGVKLNVESSRLGSVMTVVGTPNTWAQVHFEGMSLLGPTVVIDQPNNAASVDGRGVWIMPSEETTETAGRKAKSAELEIHWATSMRFEGSKARAEFRGQVHATQQPPREVRGLRKLEAAPSPRVQPVLHHQAARNPDGTVIPPPPPDDGSWTRKQLACHRLDVTFDRPVYFNNLRQSAPRPEPDALPPKDKKAGSERARLETALCIPMPDDELAKLPPDRQHLLRWVTYLEETLSREGKVLRAQRIDGPELQVRNGDREQKVFAAGPGEVRILQMGSRDGGFGEPGRPVTGTERLTKKDDQEMKLTFVEYTSRMLAEEKGGTFQQATFIDGARVWQMPSHDLHMAFVKHAPPRGTVFLACTESLKVSSDRKKPGLPAEQWMQAEGNAEFLTDEYIGSAGRITYDGKAVVFEAQKGRLARLYGRRVGVNNTKNWNAERIVYFKDGTVRTTGNSSGTIIPDQ